MWLAALALFGVWHEERMHAANTKLGAAQICASTTFSKI